MLNNMISSNKRYKDIFFFIQGLCVAYGMRGLASIDGAKFDWPIIWLISLSFFFIRKKINTAEYNKSILVNLIGFIFTLIILLGSFHVYHNKFVAFWGLYFLFCFLISVIFVGIDAVKRNVNIISTADKKIRPKSKFVFFLSFGFYWIIYFIYLLDVYPGSLCVDSVSQLRQSIGIAPYDNANPLMNTWTIGLFVRFALAVFHDINIGIALYCVFQYTLFSAVYSYGLKLLYEFGYDRLLLAIVFFMWAVIPHSIIYAVQMWKDSFFSVQLLLLYLLTWSTVVKSRSIINYFLIFIFSIVACMSRLTAWPIILIFSILILVWGRFCTDIDRKFRLKSVWGCIFCGCVLGLFLVKTIDVFDSKKTTWPYSLPEQQFSAVLSTNQPVDENDLKLLELGADVKNIKKNFNPYSVDDTASFVYRDFVLNNIGDFSNLYFKWWIKYPSVFLQEFVDMTKVYYNPLYAVWYWDTRIFENDLGVYRNRLLVSHFDRILASASESLLFKPFHRAGFYFWLIILLIGYNIIKKEYINLVFYLPLLAYFFVYMLTSPVALFRYIYPVVIISPLLVVWTIKQVCIDEKEVV